MHRSVENATPPQDHCIPSGMQPTFSLQFIQIMDNVWKTYFAELPSYGKHWGENRLWNDCVFTNKMEAIKHGINALIEKTLGGPIKITDVFEGNPFSHVISSWFVGKPGQQLPLVLVGCYSFGCHEDDDDSLIPFADFILFPFWARERIYGAEGKDHLGYVLSSDCTKPWDQQTWNPQNEWYWDYRGWDHGYPGEWDDVTIPDLSPELNK